MRVARRLVLVVFLALALAVGHQAALRHGLAHAAETFTQKQDSNPAQSKCEKCFACSQLAGAASAVVAIPELGCDHADLLSPESGASSRVALAYRSRAPPALL